MHIAHANTLLVQIFGQVLGHAFGEGCDQRAKAISSDFADFIQQIIDLHFYGPNLNLGIQKSGGPDHLLGKNAPRTLNFPI